MKNWYAKITYNDKHETQTITLTERQARKIYTNALREMVVANIKRVSYGVMEAWKIRNVIQ